MKFLLTFKIVLICLNISYIIFKCFFSSFSKKFRSLSYSLTRFFEKFIVNFLILYFKTLISFFSLSNVRRFSKIWFFIFATYSALEVNELLNFQKLFPRVGIYFKSKEKNVGASDRYKRKKELPFWWDTLVVY